MKNPFLLLWLTLFWIFQGCAKSSAFPEVTHNGVLTPSPFETSTFPVTTVIANSQTASAMHTSEPTQTPVLFITNTPTGTSTLTPEVQQSCLILHATSPSEKKYPGKIVLVGKNIYLNDPPVNVPKEYKESFFYDPSIGETTVSPTGKILDIAVSPNRSSYAIVDAADLRVKVFSIQGESLAILEQGDHEYVIDQWLDNQRILLAIIERKESAGHTWVDFPADEVAIDIFTRKEQFFPSDYPGIDDVNTPIGEGISSRTKYDSTLSRVVYLGFIEEYGEWGHVLWDVERGEKIAQIVTDGWNTPIWSPDGSKFVINNYYEGEFYVMTRDGEVSKISHLNEEGKDGSSTERIFYSQKYSWSPDGKNLAFWKETARNGFDEATLAVLDTETGDETNYCLSAGNLEDTSMVIYDLVWSPDGKSLVTIANRDEEGNFDTVLIDLERGIVMKIAENLIPQGWLDTGQK